MKREREVKEEKVVEKYGGEAGEREEDGEEWATERIRRRA